MDGDIVRIGTCFLGIESRCVADVRKWGLYWNLVVCWGCGRDCFLSSRA